MTVSQHVVVTIEGVEHELSDYTVVRRRCCDRCGTPIEEGDPYIHLYNGLPGGAAAVRVDDEGKLVVVGEISRVEIDLCQDCGALFERFVGANDTVN